MNPQEIVSLALKVSIILTLFGFGLQASRDDLLYVLRRPRVLARSLLAMFVVMPLFALLLTTIFHFELPVMIALVALAISPVPPALPRKVNKAGGVAPYGLGLMVTVATLSILYVPLAVNFIGAYFHKPFAMGPGAVAKLIGLSVLLRFFGGWDFTPEDAKTRYLAEIGYRKGVPMGGDLPKASAGAKAPSFLVAAMKDPIGANLDRVQIIKGWLDKDGKTHEQIYDVAWGNADRRKLRPGGKLPPVGDTVDVSRATWTNTIGDPELMGVWTDPHFDSSQKAFYYVRVLEIPTPRWTDYDSVRFGVKMTPDVPMKEQERAWTSPIWYTPGN